MKLADLLALVADAFDVSLDQLKGGRCTHEIVVARDAYSDLARRHTGRRAAAIGRACNVSGQIIRDGFARRLPRRMQDIVFVCRLDALDERIAEIVAAEREAQAIVRTFNDQKASIERDYAHG